MGSLSFHSPQHAVLGQLLPSRGHLCSSSFFRVQRNSIPIDASSFISCWSCSFLYKKVHVREFVVQCLAKKSRSTRKLRNSVSLQTDEILIKETNNLEGGPSSRAESVQDDQVSSSDASINSVAIASRSSVLQACSITSGLIAGLGVILREASHVASVEGLPLADCTKQISFGFEMWHLELITGLVILVSSSRYLLLKAWPDFAESSKAGNKQVLTSLEPLDYLVVAFFPGISEELLFRGALLPLLGTNWGSVLAVATLFGALHLGSGRKYSFAIWATFVGILYGYAAIISSSIVTPMVSHSLNNLIGGLLWRYSSDSSE